MDVMKARKVLLENAKARLDQFKIEYPNEHRVDRLLQVAEDFVDKNQMDKAKQEEMWNLCGLISIPVNSDFASYGVNANAIVFMSLITRFFCSDKAVMSYIREHKEFKAWSLFGLDDLEC